MRTLTDLVVPAGEARAFTIAKGRILRITALEGEQCCDAIFFNANDHRETFHAWYSYSFNCKEGTGNAFHLTTLYSKPPFERAMLTVVDDTVRSHFVICGGRCSAGIYRRRDGVEGHPNCQDNLAQAIAPYGLQAHEVPDCFNVFMNAGVDERGLMYIRPPRSRRGDHLDLRAEMDILCAISACPDELSVCNNGKAKPLGITILGAP
jgi:uncharacterized protein YcgI (DUF1989 family)